MTSFLIPNGSFTAEIEVKRSRFIAVCAHTAGLAEAKAFIKSLKQLYPDARHHCYAYIAGSPSNSNLYGYSDDNEPSGTAGRPIFNHLVHSGIGEVSIVVVRYFGGTKLGTGGLARAYSDATKQVINAITTKRHIEMEDCLIKCDFSLETLTRKNIIKKGGSIISVSYSKSVDITCKIPVNIELNLPYSVSVKSSI